LIGVGLDADHLSVAVVEELPFDDDSFDLVFGKTVFEHFEDPDASAREIARVTRAGGHLVLDVPNARNAYWTLASERARGHTHLTNVYRIEELCGFFERQGFHIDETWGDGLLYTTPYIIMSSLRRGLFHRFRAQEATSVDHAAGASLQTVSRRLQSLMGPADRVFKAGIRLLNTLAARFGLVNSRTGVIIGIVAVRESASTTTATDTA
jgi:SAM-dependent methyltransferase